MKSLLKFIVPGILLLFVGLCFPQSDAKVQKIPSKASAKPPAASVKSQPKPDQEEQIAPSAPDSMFPSVVARVNGATILGLDLEALVRAELNSIGNPGWKNLRSEYRSELTLNKMTLLINSKLLFQQAAAAGVKASEAEVQAELQKIIKTYKSEAEMIESLARQDMNLASLKKNIYDNLATSKYVDAEIGKKLVVAPEELSKYYASNPEEFRHPDIVRTSHILIRSAGDAPEQDSIARERAEVLLARIKKGEDFAKLARENSADSSASQGGDIGFAAKEALPTGYAEAAFSLPVGDVKIVKTQHGYHIIKTMDKKKEGVSSIEDVKQELTDYLKKQKYQEELKKLTDRIREKANIEILITAKEILNP